MVKTSPLEEMSRAMQEAILIISAPVAQLDRAFDYESKGRRFDSCRAYHLSLSCLEIPCRR
jgi:hypothetical protein